MARTRKEQLSPEQTPPPAPSALLDVEEAAAWFGVSRTKFFQMMHEEGFPVILITEKLIRFDPNSLYRWALGKQVNGRYVA